MIRFSVFAALLAVCIVFCGCQEKKETVSDSGISSVPSASPAPVSDTPDSGDATEKVEFNDNIDFAINYDDNFHSHGQGRFGGILAILGSHQYHVEFIPNSTTGEITAILYDDHFKPFKTETKELTLSLLVDGQPKQFTFLVNFEGSSEKPALYKISDTTLAKLLHDGWTGNAQASITIDEKPASGKLIPLKK